MHIKPVVEEELSKII